MGEVKAAFASTGIPAIAAFLTSAEEICYYYEKLLIGNYICSQKVL